MDICGGRTVEKPLYTVIQPIHGQSFPLRYLLLELPRYGATHEITRVLA